MARRLLSCTLVVAVALGAASCIDPVHADAVAALGPEAAGVREGPTHRPGQPCLTCHGGDGPGPDFAAAGTVYAVRGEAAPLVRGVVRLEDYTGKTIEVATNDVGNFYVETRRFTPVYPMFATVYDGANKTIEKKMVSRIGRDGGCGHCHKGTVAGTNLMPAVFLKDKP